MAVQKRTYALPPDTVEEFERTVPTGNRSATVAALMRQWLDEARRRRLREEIVSGLADMATEYLAVELEYHPLEEEVERESRGDSAARRGDQGPPRPRRGIRAGR